MKKTLYLLFLILFCACKENKSSELSHKSDTIKYADGFSIEKHDNYTILEIKKPWPNTTRNFKYLLVNKKKRNQLTINTEDFNGVITTPLKKIVVTSTTHIPALELLNKEETLIGFPGTNYVSSKKTRRLIDQGAIIELGRNDHINTEILLNLNPDVVIAFGIDGSSKALKTIEKANTPIIYNGDWIEKSPLAKAEWIKLFGYLYHKEKEADSIFKSIETNYLEAKKIAKHAAYKPKILSGAMHKDIWYAPSGESTEAYFLKDANTDYYWSNTTGRGSLANSFETVFNTAKDADIWISPSYYKSIEALKNSNPHYQEFKAFKNKTIYSFANTTGKTGGVLYYELGITRPDLILKDLIKICHPELLTNYEPFFFKRLN